MYESRRWSIHTIVFDLDDTLFEERAFVLSGLRAVAARIKARYAIDGFFQAAERIYLQGSRGRIFDQALEVLGISDSAALIPELISCYREHVPCISLASDAKHSLTWAAGRFRLGLLSDGYEIAQDRKIDALGIRKFFDIIILTDKIGRAYWKPSTAGFTRIMNQMGGRPLGYVYVADNPQKDFLPARASGWRTVRVRRIGGEHYTQEASAESAADREVASLIDLDHFIYPESQTLA